MNISRRLIGFVLAAPLVVGATSASAHVNWFVTEQMEGFQPYSFSDPAVLIWCALVPCMVAVSIWLDGKLPVLGVVDTKVRHDFIELLRVFTGMSFLLTAYEGALLAPHKLAVGQAGLAMLFAQAFIGIMLIANWKIKYAAIFMLLLHVAVAYKFGLASALEYSILIGIALFLLFNNLSTPKWRDLLKPYSVDVLRIWTGIALVSLAVGEKLASTALGQAFVAQYQWNFMELIGITFFDDRLFVLSAGMVELVLGIVLIIGTTTRLAVLVLSIMMALSNTVFILQGNNEAALVEFVGHMPIIGTALVLLLLGYGQRLKVTASDPVAQPEAAAQT